MRRSWTVGTRAGLVLAEAAVAVDVQVVEQLLHEVVPGGRVRLAVDEDVQAEQHRPGLAQVDEGLHVARLRARCGPAAEPPRPGARPAPGRRRRPQRGQGQQPGGRDDEAVHAGTSLIGLAVLSTMRMGRPTLDWFCLVGSMPRARQTVARKSVAGDRALGDGHAVGAGLADDLAALDAAAGQHRAPGVGEVVAAVACRLICGVRPNSPIQTISVDVEQAALLQVGHQRRPGRVERRRSGS